MEQIFIALSSKYGLPIVFIVSQALVCLRIEKIEANIAIKMLTHCLSCANYKKKEGTDV